MLKTGSLMSEDTAIWKRSNIRRADKSDAGMIDGLKTDASMTSSKITTTMVITVIIILDRPLLLISLKLAPFKLLGQVFFNLFIISTIYWHSCVNLKEEII